jgi:hypothetical protein
MIGLFSAFAASETVIEGAGDRGPSFRPSGKRPGEYRRALVSHTDTPHPPGALRRVATLSAHAALLGLGL